MINIILFDNLSLPRVLNDTVFNFPNNQEEITFGVAPEILRVKNYVDDEPGIKLIIIPPLTPPSLPTPRSPTPQSRTPRSLTK